MLGYNSVTSDRRNTIFPGEVSEPKPDIRHSLAFQVGRLHMSLQVYDRLSLIRVCLLSLITILFIKESQYTKFNGAKHSYMLINYLLIL